MVAGWLPRRAVVAILSLPVVYVPGSRCNRDRGSGWWFRLQVVR